MNLVLDLVLDCDLFSYNPMDSGDSMNRPTAGLASVADLCSLPLWLVLWSPLWYGLVAYPKRFTSNGLPQLTYRK